jgi:hypothetical protein
MSFTQINLNLKLKFSLFDENFVKKLQRLTFNTNEYQKKSQCLANKEYIIRLFHLKFTYKKCICNK